MKLYCKSSSINTIDNYCHSIDEILESNILKVLLKKHIEKLADNYKEMYQFLSCDKYSNEEIERNLLKEVRTIINEKKLGMYSTANKKAFSLLVSEFLDCWKKIQKYAFIYTHGKNNEINLIEKSEKLNSLVTAIYFAINEVLKTKVQVIRKENYGLTSALKIVQKANDFSKRHFPQLKDISFIETIYFETPIVFFTKFNRREGRFQLLEENYIENLTFDDNWLSIAVYIGEYLARIYFHKDFISIGVSVTGIFEMAKSEDLGKKPEIILVYGHQDVKEGFFYDSKRKMMFGYLPYTHKMEYFGYMKKMCLTLHNILMIKKGYLPIHGAMASIVFKDNKRVNVVIVGDSGAGKSETLEALRAVAGDKIKYIETIFDDMGTFKIENNQLLAYGTEVGAFIRLDDLEFQVAYRNIDKAIYMNPTNSNARMILPVNEYERVIMGHHVDFLLYANNFIAMRDLEIFSDYKMAIATFRRGDRMAIGTTNESGIVQSYFSNPFGPYQYQKECDKLLEKYFKFIFAQDIKVGELFTQLALPLMQKEGPRKAADLLLKLFEK